MYTVVKSFGVSIFGITRLSWLTESFLKDAVVFELSMRWF